MEKMKTDLYVEGFTVRAPTLEDVDAVVELINAAALADTGLPATTKAERLTLWTLPEFSLETDARLVLTRDGQLGGYIELWDSKPHVRHYLWGRVHPDHRGRGIGGQMMAWAEIRARESLDRAPPQARVSLHTSAPYQDKAAHDLFQVLGFSLARHFYRMIIEMAPGILPPKPVLPGGIALRPFILGQDDRATHQTIDEAFKDHWGYVEGESFEEWMHWIEQDPTFDPTTCFVAVIQGNGEEIVGAAMTHPEWEGDPTIAWIDELAVLRRWRRKGIGRALLHRVFRAYHGRGKYRVGLGVDGGSLTGATRLYEQAGMRVFQQTDAYEKVLRPGEELSTHALED